MKILVPFLYLVILLLLTPAQAGVKLTQRPAGRGFLTQACPHQENQQTPPENLHGADLDKERSKDMKYDTHLQVLPSTITQLYTTVDDPLPEKTTKEIAQWLTGGDFKL
jgi:hypothetical protein